MAGVGLVRHRGRLAGLDRDRLADGAAADRDGLDVVGDATEDDLDVMARLDVVEGVARRVLLDVDRLAVDGDARELIARVGGVLDDGRLALLDGLALGDGAALDRGRDVIGALGEHGLDGMVGLHLVEGVARRVLLDVDRLAVDGEAHQMATLIGGIGNGRGLAVGDARGPADGAALDLGGDVVDGIRVDHVDDVAAVEVLEGVARRVLGDVDLGAVHGHALQAVARVGRVLDLHRGTGVQPGLGGVDGAMDGAGRHGQVLVGLLEIDLDVVVLAHVGDGVRLRIGLDVDGLAVIGDAREAVAVGGLVRDGGLAAVLGGAAAPSLAVDAGGLDGERILLEDDVDRGRGLDGGDGHRLGGLVGRDVGAVDLYRLQVIALGRLVGDDRVGAVVGRERGRDGAALDRGRHGDAVLLEDHVDGMVGLDGIEGVARRMRADVDGLAVHGHALDVVARLGRVIDGLGLIGRDLASGVDGAAGIGGGRDGMLVGLVDDLDALVGHDGLERDGVLVGRDVLVNAVDLDRLQVIARLGRVVDGHLAVVLDEGRRVDGAVGDRGGHRAIVLLGEDDLDGVVLMDVGERVALGVLVGDVDAVDHHGDEGVAVVGLKPERAAIAIGNGDVA